MSFKKYILLFIIIIFSITICFFSIFKNNQIVKNKDQKKDNEIDKSLININTLSEEFMDQYFSDVSNIEKTEKENILITTSKDSDFDTYGAKKKIISPNNQYILVYDSIDQKNEAKEKFKNDKNIISCDDNNVYKVEDTYNSWGVSSMKLDSAKKQTNARNTKIDFSLNEVTIAILDTGVDLNLANKYYPNKAKEIYNVVNNSFSLIDDDDGHGTHIFGTIAESTSDNISILPVKVGSGSVMYDTDVIAGINYIVRNNKASVINMSFGSYTRTNALKDAIDYANSFNIICVAAAGNDNKDQKHYPSEYNSTISIASVDSNLDKSSFSNYGSSITFCAPGTKIKSILSDGQSKKTQTNTIDNDHAYLSGTSMATPHAASAIGYLKSYNKDLSIDECIELLRQYAKDLGSPGWDQYFGYGYISFDGAIFHENNYDGDEFNVFKNAELASIVDIELKNISYTQNNYYSVNNILDSQIQVKYKNDETKLFKLYQIPGLEILDYNPNTNLSQTIRIKFSDIEKTCTIPASSYTSSGWEYEIINNKAYLSGYIDNNLKIDKLYVPNKIGNIDIVGFKDNVMFNKYLDFSLYNQIYLPQNFNKIGSFCFKDLNIIDLYGSNILEIANNAFENSKITNIYCIINKAGNYCFNNCKNLKEITLDCDENQKTYIGEYSFSRCLNLEKVSKYNNKKIIVDNIGQYAFSSCINLEKIGFNLSGDINKYAFSNTEMLKKVEFLEVDKICEKSFYRSGITNASLGTVSIIDNNAFEGCANLTGVTTRYDEDKNNMLVINEKAFYNSIISVIQFANNISYISDDAFGYCNIKSINNLENDKYKIDDTFGIIDKESNKLIKGIVSDNVINLNNIVEIGDYAYSGSQMKNNIIISENVNKIGRYAFSDTNKSYNIYILGINTISYETTFIRLSTKESLMNVHVLNNYNYIDQLSKYANSKIRFIDPTSYEITGLNDSYTAFDTIDISKLKVTLFYEDGLNWSETIGVLDDTYSGILGTGKGFSIEYKNNDYLEYDDKYFTLKTKNYLGYSKDFDVSINVNKKTPQYTIPNNLSGIYNQKLKDIILPDNFYWEDENIILNNLGDNSYKARYEMPDTKNYEIIDDIDIIVSVKQGNDNIINNTKDIIVPYDKKNHEIQIDLNIDNYQIYYSQDRKKYNLNKMQECINPGNYKIYYKIVKDGNEYFYLNSITIYGITQVNNDLKLKEDIIIAKDKTYLELENNINVNSSNYKVEVLDSNNKVIINDSNKNNNDKKQYILKTSDKIRITIDNFKIEYKIANPGDVNGDGKMNIIDYVLIMKHIMDWEYLHNENFYAADVNQNEKIDIIDYIIIMNHIMEED